MLNVSKLAFFFLFSSAVATAGCVVESPPEEGDDATQEDVEGEEARSEDDEDVGEAEQPILGGQTEIKASNGLCWNASSTTVLTLATCNLSAKQSWVIDPNTGLIKNAHYWGRCAAIPKALTGRIALVPCDLYDSYQWFPFVPPADGQGLICGWVKDPAGNNRCASHVGTGAVYTAAPSGAPDWYRYDL